MISQAQSEEQVALEALYAAAFAPLRVHYFAKGVPDGPQRDPVCLVYKSESQILGAISYYLDPPYARLFRIAVHPAHQGKGIATRLIRYVEDRVARPHGLDLALFVITETGNARIFARMGFVVRAETIATLAVAPDGSPVHETEMTKAVT